MKLSIISINIYVIVISIMLTITKSFQLLNNKNIRFKFQVLNLTTNIYIVGKKNGGEPFISDGCNEYEKRLKPTMTITTHFLKSDDALVDAVKNSRGIVLALDENGKQYTSREFSKVVYDGLEEGGAPLNFVIGGFDGLPNQIKSTARLISLSRMTWTHQMARLLLLEQVYRACEIHKGTAYHKD